MKRTVDIPMINQHKQGRQILRGLTNKANYSMMIMISPACLLSHTHRLYLGLPSGKVAAGSLWGLNLHSSL